MVLPVAILVCLILLCCYSHAHVLNVNQARVEYSFKYNTSNNFKNISGFYGMESPILDRYGEVVHVLTIDRTNHGCDSIINAPTNISWIALIRRGDCKFNTKIQNAVSANASAVIVYSDRNDDGPVMMSHIPVNHVVTLFIMKNDGDIMAKLIDNGLAVKASITVAKIFTNAARYSGDDPDDKSNFMLILSLTLVGIFFLMILIVCIYVFNRSKFLRNKNSPQQVLTMEELMQAQQRLVQSSEYNDC